MRLIFEECEHDVWRLIVPLECGVTFALEMVNLAIEMMPDTVWRVRIRP